MDEDGLLNDYRKVFKQKNASIIQALKTWLTVYLKRYKALTDKECEQIDALDADKRPAEIIRLVTMKDDIVSYIGLSRTIWFSGAIPENAFLDIFTFVKNTWWLRILHYEMKADARTPPEPEEGSLNVMWLAASREERDIAVSALQENVKRANEEMPLVIDKSIEGCHCATYDPKGTLFHWEKRRLLTVVYIEDLFSFFKGDAIGTLLAHYKPCIVVLTGTCTARDSAPAKPGDTVVITNDSTPWHGELQHMSEIWRLEEARQQRVVFHKAEYLCTKGVILASPEASLFYHKMKKCSSQGIINFAAMVVPDIAQKVPIKPKADTGKLTSNATFVVKALGYFADNYEAIKYKT